jgi:hypothetical protein
MKLRLGEEPPTVAKKKKKDSPKLDDFAEIYFKEKEIEVKDIEKLKKRQAELKAQEKKFLATLKCRFFAR